MTATIFTVEDTFTASVHHVRLQPVPGNSLATLILTIQWLEATNILVHVNVHGGKWFFAVGAINGSIWTSVHDMILHVNSGYSCTTCLDTEDSIFLASVEMTLQSA